MSNDLLRFCRIFLFRNPSAVRLSVFKGMGHCRWPISFNVVIMGTANFLLWWTVPTSASAADDITLRSVTHSVKIGPLGVGVGMECVLLILSLR